MEQISSKHWRMSKVNTKLASSELTAFGYIRDLFLIKHGDQNSLKALVAMSTSMFMVVNLWCQVPEYLQLGSKHLIPDWQEVKLSWTQLRSKQYIRGKSDRIWDHA